VSIGIGLFNHSVQALPHGAHSWLVSPATNGSNQLDTITKISILHFGF